MSEKFKDLIGKKAIKYDGQEIVISNIKKLSETMTVVYYGEQGIINIELLKNPETGKFLMEEII